MLGVLAAVSLALAYGFMDATRFVDRLDRTSEQQQVANYLKRQGDASIAQQKVQLTWDDAFNHAAGPVDGAWTDTYLGDFLWTNFHYDRLFLVDPRGRVMRGWSDGKFDPRASLGPLAPEVSRLLRSMEREGQVFGSPAGTTRLADSQWPVDAQGRPLTRWNQALVRFEGRAAQLTVASILPDTDYAMLVRTPNHLVTVRFLDARFLDAMREALLLEPVSFALTHHGGGNRNALPLIASTGESLGWLSWQSVPQSLLVRDRVRPMFMAYMLFLLALLAGGATIIKLLQRTMNQLRQREAQALHEARHDPMTGLPNRAHFIEQLDRRLRRLPDDGKTAIAVAFIDLDNFKYVNDTLGHSLGDELVRQVAERCRKRFSGADVLARLGGDEFVLMRAGLVGESAMTNLGRDLMSIFAAPFKVGDRVIDITASCGISWAPHHGHTASDVLRNADIALYRAKQRGRARWRAFTPEMESAVRQRLVLEGELRRALQTDALSLAYQPIVRAEDGSIDGVEALLRWEHPELGNVSPAQFVPVAEQAGLMPLLGWWTIGRVFQQCRAWPQLNVSINLSPLQLVARNFVEDLEVLAREYRITPSRITFEVTEGILLEHGTGAFDMLGRLKDMGFCVALDDFGTGYSSLSYLRTFRFDRIKIDRAFVHNIDNDLSGQAILKAIVALGHSLETRTVAEGVETPLQRQLVMSAGCDLIQGFLYWCPMDAAALDRLLARQPFARAGRAAWHEPAESSQPLPQAGGERDLRLRGKR